MLRLGVDRDDERGVDVCETQERGAERRAAPKHALTGLVEHIPWVPSWLSTGMACPA